MAVVQVFVDPGQEHESMKEYKQFVVVQAWAGALQKWAKD